MKVREIYDVIDAFAPYAAQMPWDNSGLAVGSMDDEFDRALVTIDCSPASLEAARRNLAQEYDNRDELVEGIEEVSNQLREYKDLARRLQEDLDERERMLGDRIRELDELRAQYDALAHEDGGEALAG